jgi:O-antigen ligase
MSARAPGVEVPAGAGLGQGMRSHAAVVLPIAFGVAMPLTLFHIGAVVHATAWAWFLDLAVIGSLAMVEPLHPRAVRYLLPYVAFIGYCVLSLAWTPDLSKGVLTLLQVTVPALAYLVAWRLAGRAEEFMARIAQACMLALGLVVVLWLFGVAGVEPLSLAVRPAAISLAVIFVGISLGTHSRHLTVLAGLTAILVAGLTGSRSATAVLLILLICSPTLGLRAHWRVGIALLVVVAVVGLSHTEAFKERFFFDRNASLVDALTFSGELNTAGRREVWPRLAERCASSAAVGNGIGAAAGIAKSLGNFGEPHNDYLRTYCDVGIGGSILFWGFFLFALVRCFRRARRAVDQRPLQAGAGLLVLAFMLDAITDNPMVYTGHFLVPVAIILGLADAGWHATWTARQTDPWVGATPPG